MRFSRAQLIGALSLLALIWLIILSRLLLTRP
jgi:hypothetical protein